MDTPLARWLEVLPQQVERVWRERPHGDMPAWQEAISQLPELVTSTISLSSPCIRAGVAADCDDQAREHIRQQLMCLHPWRKGPFEICGLHIDTEWCSDRKWERLQPHIQPLHNRLILDVGCGNGYYALRMAGEGARQVIGIDPTQLFLHQFEALRHFLGKQHPVHLLPLGIEDIPPNLQAFDTVFSMGVFYHRRSPFSHLSELKGCLRKGGELVLETLVIEGGPGEVLVPEGRYAKMRNVWFIPSPATLISWLSRAGFGDVRLIDVTTTSVEEQRATEWMRFESLADYLDPSQPAQTVEGHPAPRRAIIVAHT
ncbi:MAG: tRNA 5-methoxyuridine(34)/uridine 5-oxyacetic acid(34) synthase CmoB [Candidatus Thiodiazotropha sp. (ex Myrtea sp. 'scaly one' KF741663)]|nr:tRNA 5-methoxyuridine(34)/uridine 5-oxyacetic acid(34) synthase CmoB [Candidatus Thiodiazotropha sp. (ex Myrtea sp. 'scaly one' KF741663)]